jgi:formylglycine-generating enzyme required for sulfatase activity
LIELGLQHEQQHQELLLTDVLHLLSCNPLAPVYQRALAVGARGASAVGLAAPVPPVWWKWGTRAVRVLPLTTKAHATAHWLQPHALANRLTTHGEWADFMADGGYTQPALVAGGRLGLGAQPGHTKRRCIGSLERVAAGAASPCTAWCRLTRTRRVTHISLYEADAYARWASAQWKLAAASADRV